MASNITNLNSYSKGSSIIRGDFLLSTNDPNDCYTGGTTIIEDSDSFISEAGNIIPPTVDAGCGCTNDYVKFWYPIYSQYDGGAIYFGFSNPTGYSKVVSKVTNANSLTRSLEGTITSYDCGYTHCNLKISGSYSGAVYDVRGGIYQQVGYIDYCTIEAGATFYTPNEYLTVSQGSSFGAGYPLGYYKNQGNLFLKDVYGSIKYKFTGFSNFDFYGDAGGGVMIYELNLSKADNTTLYSGGIWSGYGLINTINTKYNGSSLYSNINMVNVFLNPITYYNKYTTMMLFPQGAGNNVTTLPEIRLTNPNLNPGAGGSANAAWGAWAQTSDFFRNLTYTYELTCPVNPL